jgi:glycosyltransferase involved in cell wall biosynthesis
MRVLVLSQYFWPESFRINEVVESLQQVGCSVTVLTGKPNYPEGTIFQGYSAFGHNRQKHRAGYMIYRVPIVPRGSGKTLSLLANYLSFLICASVCGPWLLRGQTFDVIFVYGISPILQAIPAILLKRLKRAAVVTWVQDLWPQSLESTGFVSNRPLLALVGVVVRWIYRHSDLLLVQSQAFIPTVGSMVSRTPVEYHPNPGEVAFSRFQPSDSPELKLQAGFNVVFAGNLGTVQALGTIMDAAEILRKCDDVRLVIIGSGGRKAWLEEEIARRGLENVQLPGRFSANAMPGILAQASVLLVSLRKDPIMCLTVPSKIQAYLAAGRPVIGSLDGEGARVILEARAGLACPAEDAPALAEAILQLRRSSWIELRRMGEAGREYYKTHFEPDMLARRLAEHFRRIACQCQRSH